MRAESLTWGTIVSGILLAVIVATASQLRTSRAHTLQAAQAAADNAAALNRSALAQRAAIALFGLDRVVGDVVPEGSEPRAGGWEPEPEGRSIAVFVTPSCPRSFQLLRELVQGASTEAPPPNILVASLAGDDRAVASLRTRLGSHAPLKLEFMVRPRWRGSRIAVDAVPTLFHWVDGSLTDVHVGVGWAALDPSTHR